jgi:hypothetical protein
LERIACKGLSAKDSMEGISQMISEKNAFTERISCKELSGSICIGGFRFPMRNCRERDE